LLTATNITTLETARSSGKQLPLKHLLSILNNEQEKTVTLTWQFAESATWNVNE